MESNAEGNGKIGVKEEKKGRKRRWELKKRAEELVGWLVGWLILESSLVFQSSSIGFFLAL